MDEDVPNEETKDWSLEDKMYHANKHYFKITQDEQLKSYNWIFTIQGWANENVLILKKLQENHKKLNIKFIVAEREEGTKFGYEHIQGCIGYGSPRTWKQVHSQLNNDIEHVYLRRMFGAQELAREYCRKESHEDPQKIIVDWEWKDEDD